MESNTKPMVDVIITKAVVLYSHKVKVFTKSLSRKKHLNGNEKRACISLLSIRIVHCSETVSKMYWKYVLWFGKLKKIITKTRSKYHIITYIITRIII